MFKDREQAGEILAKNLEKYRGKNLIVLAIPRGGVIVAKEVAKKLDAKLDLIISRKIGSPTDPEFAIGAVGPDRTILLNEEVVKEIGVTKGYIDRMKKIEGIEIDRRMKKYRGTSEPLNVKGKIVIIVDDGIATGFTMKSVIEFLKKMKPKKIIVAIPVSSPDSVEELKEEVDEVICLESPHYFSAISQIYESFPQVTDEEVIKLLKNYGARGI